MQDGSDGGGVEREEQFRWVGEEQTLKGQGNLELVPGRAERDWCASVIHTQTEK